MLRRKKRREYTRKGPRNERKIEKEEKKTTKRNKTDSIIYNRLYKYRLIVSWHGNIWIYCGYVWPLCSCCCFSFLNPICNAVCFVCNKPSKTCAHIFFRTQQAAIVCSIDFTQMCIIFGFFFFRFKTITCLCVLCKSESKSERCIERNREKSHMLDSQVNCCVSSPFVTSHSGCAIRKSSTKLKIENAPGTQNCPTIN